MAIVVEQEKTPINWVSIGTILVVIAMLFFGSYYLFFKKPELIEIVAPRSLEGVSQISKLTFNPESVLNSNLFKSLRRFDSPVIPPSAGRSNPFKPF